MERQVKFYRGCITRGYTSEIGHCGNEECPSCNMMNRAIQEELDKMIADYTIADDNKNSDIYWTANTKKVIGDMFKDKKDDE